MALYPFLVDFDFYQVRWVAVVGCGELVNRIGRDGCGSFVTASYSLMAYCLNIGRRPE